MKDTKYKYKLSTLIKIQGNILSSKDISHAEKSLLFYLISRPIKFHPGTIKCAEGIGCSQQHASNLIKSLIKKGIIVCPDGIDNRRRKKLKLHPDFEAQMLTNNTVDDTDDDIENNTTDISDLHKVDLSEINPFPPASNELTVFDILEIAKENGDPRYTTIEDLYENRKVPSWIKREMRERGMQVEEDVKAEAKQAEAVKKVPSNRITASDCTDDFFKGIFDKRYQS